jgi:hypothetical protein
MWHPIRFVLSNGKNTYTPDLYLIERDVYIEIKGAWISDALSKWEEFKEAYPTAELWDRDKLRSIGIKIK